MSNNASNAPTVYNPYNTGPLTPPGYPGTTVMPSGTAGLYSQTTEQLFAYGTRCVSPYGRVWKYAYFKTGGQGGALAANGFPETSTTNRHIVATTLPVAIVAGDMYCTVTYPTSAGYASTGFAKNELVGGFIVVGHGAEATAETRLIIGNDAMTATTSTAKIYVDFPFYSAHAITHSAEAYPNPYMYLVGGLTNKDYNGWMGVQNINTTATYSSWIQTWGPCWVIPGGSSSSTWGEAAGDRRAFAVGDGSVNDGTTLTTGSYYRQIIGWTIDNTASNFTAMPLIMLQIST